MGLIPPSVRQTVQFGIFEVDLRAGELRKQGIRIRLQEQPLQVLSMLLESPGRVVTREDLRQRIWPTRVTCRSLPAQTRASGPTCFA